MGEVLCNNRCQRLKDVNCEESERNIASEGVLELLTPELWSILDDRVQRGNRIIPSSDHIKVTTFLVNELFRMLDLDFKFLFWFLSILLSNLSDVVLSLDLPSSDCLSNKNDAHLISSGSNTRNETVS